MRRRRRARARAWDGRDHTAPWRCGAVECGLCVGKPTYAEWALAKARQREQREQARDQRALRERARRRRS